MSTYAASEIYRQLERGPFDGEDFFRLKVSGLTTTKWVNVTREQLEKIAAILDDGT